MDRIRYILTLTFLAIALSCCQKFEIITQDGSILTVNIGYRPKGNPNKIIFGKKTETDTTTGEIMSVSKYRCKGQCTGGFMGREKCISRTRIYKDGKWTIDWTRTKAKYEF